MYSLNEDLTISELCLNPSYDLQELVSAYNNTLMVALDKHAPLLTRTIVQRPRVPWFSQEIREAKRQRRTEGCKEVEEISIVFKAKRNFITRLMNKAQREFYRSFMDENSGDQKKLFCASQRLFNRSIDDSLPPNLEIRIFSDDLGEYFIQKIDTIRTKLDAEQQPDSLPEDDTPPAVFDEIVLSFPTFMMPSV